MVRYWLTLTTKVYEARKTGIKLHNLLTNWMSASAALQSFGQCRRLIAMGRFRHNTQETSQSHRRLYLHSRKTLRRQVVRVSGRRPHSRLPQSMRTKNRVDETADANQTQTPASVGWRTDTRAACPASTST